jgi:hypothetical protein
MSTLKMHTINFQFIKSSVLCALLLIAATPTKAQKTIECKAVDEIVTSIYAEARTSSDKESQDAFIKSITLIHEKINYCEATNKIFKKIEVAISNTKPSPIPIPKPGPGGGDSEGASRPKQ